MSDDDWGSPKATPMRSDLNDGKGHSGTADIKFTSLDDPQQGAATVKQDGWVEAQPYNYDSYAATSEAQWEGNARVYEFDGETGEVGPEFPELELELFGEVHNRGGHGIDFSK
jgi:ATP-dependent RNA helicase DDX3X